MTDQRLRELMELSRSPSGDVRDVAIWEIGLLPETREERMLREEEIASAEADTYATVTEAPDADALARLAEDAEF